MVYLSYFTCGLTCGLHFQVKLCDPSFTRVIPERLGDESFMVTRYRNLLLLYLLYVDFMTLPTVASFFFRTESVLKRRRHQTAGGRHMPQCPMPGGATGH